MNRIPDRAKMRREYLGKKASVKMQQAIGFVVLLVCGLLIGLFALFLFVTIILAMSMGFTNPYSGGIGIFLFAGLAVFGIMSRVGFSIIREARDQEEKLPYVAPVRLQIPTLSAREVLLRGSKPSDTSPGELLRAAEGSREAPREDLLLPIGVQESHHVQSEEA